MTIFSDLRSVVSGDSQPQEVSVCAIGGIPIIKREESYFLLNAPIEDIDLSKMFSEMLGLGAVLTFKNPKNKSLQELGDLCLSLNHGWTLHEMKITVLYWEAPISVRNTLAFDRRFHLSWVEKETRSELTTFTATASMKEYLKLFKRSEDKSWKKSQRLWFKKTTSILKKLWPEYFNDSK